MEDQLSFEIIQCSNPRCNYKLIIRGDRSSCSRCGSKIEIIARGVQR